MSKYGGIQEDFYTERTRILQAFHEKENQHIIIRLIGALAFRTHCPQYGYIQENLGRVFTDFDFASYPRFFKDISRVLNELGYKENMQVTQLFGDTRLLFNEPAYERHIDVFGNKLDFCHPINFVGRLELEEFTLPLAELLLEKMQIVRINPKDLIDTVMLLREHILGETDQETINVKILTRTLSNDWGFYHTVTKNLALLNEMLDGYKDLNPEDRQIVKERIEDLQRRIEVAPKSLKWKTRAAIGEKVKWYKDVEELTR